MVVAVGVLTIANAKVALAEWKPTRPINVIVPYKAGGGTDSFARAISAVSEGAFPVPLVIVNKPGASGITGASEASRARPDGSTIMLTSAGSFLLTSMLRDTEVNPFDHFTAIAQIGNLTAAIMVPADSPYQTLEDLVADLLARPDELRWAHTGNGSFIQVAGQGFLNANGLSTIGVPFKGGSGVRTAIIGKQVDFGFLGVQQSAGFENEMRVLAVNAVERDPILNQHPTIFEQGYEFVNISSPIMAFAPKDTDAESLAGLEAAFLAATETPELAEIMLERGNVPAFLSSDDASARLAEMRSLAEPIIAAIR
ncbi:MAG: twin-arginine translocation pathway signal protein [Blastopirellula sp.]|nr:MAG: twin-arginine translocation pathway signal protein [Blastopirellula sp.]